jgi:histidyl-tRNA synthetase
VYLALAGVSAEAAGLRLAESLRDAVPGLRIETHCGGGSFKSQLKRADRSGARVAVIIGDDEASRRVAAVKALRGREAAQREVSFDELAAELARELRAQPT